MAVKNSPPKIGQKKARVQSTPGRVMGTFPLSPEEGEFGDLYRRIAGLTLGEIAMNWVAMGWISWIPGRRYQSLNPQPR
jgi:hypothetical protein